MFELIIVLVPFVLALSLWAYCIYKNYTSNMREKETIDKALKDAGYV